MSDFTANRPGQNLGTGSVDALFRKIFLTEVITALRTQNVTNDFFNSRTITGGKSVAFPATGRAGGGLHSPGKRLKGRQIQHTEVVINVEGEYVSDVFLARIDDAKAHYNVRRPYVQSMGFFLAKLFDTHNFLAAIKAARSPARIPGQTGAGGRIENASMATDASVLAAAIFQARAKLDELGVPDSDVILFLRPEQYNLLVQAKETINKDYNGRGSYADGDINSIAGVDIVKTSHLPNRWFSAANPNIDADFASWMQADVAFVDADSGQPNIPAHLQLDCRTTVGLIAHRDAIGIVNLLDMNLDTDWIPDARGWLFVASQSRGVDSVRPECAIELATGPVA